MVFVRPLLRLKGKSILPVRHAVVIVVVIQVICHPVAVDIRGAVGRNQQGQIDGEFRCLEGPATGRGLKDVQDGSGPGRVPVPRRRPGDINRHFHVPHGLGVAVEMMQVRGNPVVRRQSIGANTIRRGYRRRRDLHIGV